MGQVLLLLVVALTVAAVVFGVTVLVTGSDPGLGTVEPDGRAVPLPGNRPLLETDVGQVRFDTGLRGYRMAQVDQALRRTAYDIGYKDELIGVLQAEVTALREGRLDDAETLRQAREAALVPAGSGSGSGGGSVPIAGALADPTTAGAERTSPSNGASGVPVGPGPAEPARIESGRADFGPATFDRTEDRTEPEDRTVPQDRTEPEDRTVPQDRAESAGRTLPLGGAESTERVGSADRPGGDQNDDGGDPAAPTRPLRPGGSVIEAEDGDLAAPTRPVRSAAAPEPNAPAPQDGVENDAPTTRVHRSTGAGATGSTDGDEPEPDAVTKPVRRPTQASRPAQSGTSTGPDASAGANASAESGTPAERPERT